MICAPRPSIGPAAASLTACFSILPTPVFGNVVRTSMLFITFNSVESSRRDPVNHDPDMAAEVTPELNEKMRCANSSGDCCTAAPDHEGLNAASGRYVRFEFPEWLNMLWSTAPGFARYCAFVMELGRSPTFATKARVLEAKRSATSGISTGTA